MAGRLVDVLTYHFKLGRMRARINAQPKRVMVPFVLDELRLTTMNSYRVASWKGFGYQMSDVFHVFKALAQECLGWSDHAA